MKANNHDKARDRGQLLTSLLGQSPDTASKNHMADELIRANVGLRQAYKELYILNPRHPIFDDGIVGDLPEVRAARLKAAPWWKRLACRLATWIMPKI